MHELVLSVFKRPFPSFWAIIFYGDVMSNVNKVYFVKTEQQKRRQFYTKCI